MMGLAIAHEVRDQVSFVQEPLTPYPEFKDWGFEVVNDKDYGEQITVV